MDKIVLLVDLVFLGSSLLVMCCHLHFKTIGDPQTDCWKGHPTVCLKGSRCAQCASLTQD